MFGETKWSDIPGLLGLLQNLIDRTSNIVLVGHAFLSDLRVLESLGFDLKTSIIGIIDTDLEARGILGESEVRRGSRLRDVLERLRCHVGGCHIAGNDANFTLRVLLLLAAEAHSGSEDSLNETMRERLNMINAICHSLLPVPQHY